VSSVFDLCFDGGGSVYGVCARMCTHTHIHCKWGTRMCTVETDTDSLCRLYLIYVLMGVGVYMVYVRVCAHTHTHTASGVLGCEPRARDRDETLGGPEEFRWTNSRQTCIRTRVQSTHVCICWEAG